MEKANIWLALNEDMANMVPKSGVTPAEVALLTAIHGENSVRDIDILDEDADIAGRQLLQNLSFRYGGAVDSDNTPIIRKVFPTSTSPVPQTFGELGLSDEQFTAASVEKMLGDGASTKSIDDMTKAELVAFAQAKDIDINASDNKSVVLSAIEAALADESGGPGSALG
ncbi:hypothetical protein PhaeoP66_03209 [Phaeobacter inhibens]|uniref:Rho termination factor N-terminal domain-containing protein n=1 Tax=Phaeobacter inhibens TaxID=221822 RepID=A0ABM6RHJ8_9RHOB|nr:hypothetical protein [Phaeobacter inhibens]AUQ95951.1 hypothetical protein PhaeoP66_03209 [Phaeobacter inhibens]